MAFDLFTPIKDILVAKSVGVYTAGVQTAAWSIYYDYVPKAEPDQCITIHCRGGGDSNPAWLLDYPRIQVRVRSKQGSIVEANQKANTVMEALNGYPSTTFGSDRWVGIWNRGGVVPLELDKNDRPQYVVNFQCIVEPGATAETNRQALPS